MLFAPEWDYFCNFLISSCNFQSPDLYKMYTEELKESRISYGDGGELIWVLLDFSTRTSALYEQYKVKICVFSPLKKRKKKKENFGIFFVFDIYMLGDVEK